MSSTGGLKACAWADLIQGSALILGGGVIMWFAFDKLGGATQAPRVVDVATGAVTVTSLTPGSGAVERFLELNRAAHDTCSCRATTRSCRGRR